MSDRTYLVSPETAMKIDAEITRLNAEIVKKDKLIEIVKEHGIKTGRIAPEFWDYINLRDVATNKLPEYLRKAIRPQENEE